MELKEFISSGIIESYLLGTASPQEIQLVRDMISRYPEVQQEIDAVENSLLVLAESKEVNPSPHVKANILDAINGKGKSTSNNNTVEFKSSLSPKKSNLRYYAAAAIVLFIVSAAFNVISYLNIHHMNNEMVKLQKENVGLSSLMKAQNESLNSMRTDMMIMTNPHNQKIVLKGLEISPSSTATIYWNNEQNDVFMMVHSLPPAPAGKQYQLWAIVDGKPMDAGVFNDDVSGEFIKMKSMSTPQAFAVTLENMGGSTVPTMDAMYLMGEV